MTDYSDIIKREYLLCEIETFIEDAPTDVLEKIIEFLKNLSISVP